MRINWDDNPTPMCWRARIYGAWLIVSDRMAAALATLELTEVRLCSPETERVPPLPAGYVEELKVWRELSSR